jgi:cobalt-zinc-cadmium efflux system outer membrane protein
VKRILRSAGAVALACLWAAGLLAQTPQPSTQTGQTGQTGQMAQLAGQPAPAALPPLPNELTLEAATERFLQRNLSVEAARLEVGVAEAERLAASFRPRPGLTITGENLGVSGPSQFRNLYELGFIVAQPIELGGRKALRREVAEHTVSLAEARLANVLQRRLLDLRRGYMEAALARANLEIARDNQAAFAELVRLNTVRVKEGDVAEVELMRVRVEQVKFDSAVASASLAYQQAKVRLLELLGESDYAGADTLELRTPLISVQVEPEIARLREVALQRRPEIKMAEEEKALAESTLRLENSRGKGEITPFAGYKRLGNDDTLTVGVTVPLPFGNRNQSGIARAAAQKQVAETNYQLMRNRVLAEVESAYRAYMTAREQVRAYEAGLLDQAEEAAGVTAAAYREGAATLIALIDAQRARSEARGNYMKALFDYRNSLFTLEQVTGAEVN